MSRLDDIEREAKERRADNEPDFDWSMLGRGEMEGLWRQAEAAVDELVAMVKERDQTLDEITGGMWTVDHSQVLRERDEARADVKKCREALLSHMPRFDIEHKVLAETDREEYR